MKMDDYSRKISDRLWNQPDKGILESQREETFTDDIVAKHHVDRLLAESLEGIESVFDGGGGSGRFSVPLAKRGLRVTHFDISGPMIAQAKAYAAREGVLDRMTFVQGALEDLSAYASHSFDLVLSTDAPISYTYPNQERVLAELVRIAGKKVIFGVSSRLGSLPYHAFPANKRVYLLREDGQDDMTRWLHAEWDRLIENMTFSKAACEETLRTGLMHDVDEEIQAYERGETPWAVTYTFLPDELEGILERLGVRNIRLAGPGAFARTLPREVLQRVMNDPAQRGDFLDFCYTFDNNPYVCGLGKDNLLAYGEF